MTARMRRLASDWEQIKKDFAGHKNITVTPIGDEPPEKYHVTYFVNGIYLLPDGKIETLGRHEVEITLHAEYPRYKPICKILTPIWHPNFRDGQICIGDIWGAGESLSDIIINIGNMIQYRSWNSSSPLSADAAQWAIQNKHLFPIGKIDLYPGEQVSANDVDIDLFNDDGTKIAGKSSDDITTEDVDLSSTKETVDGNDFEITAEELEGIEYIPTAQRTQNYPQLTASTPEGLNFKTIFQKGLLWALIGGFLGFVLQELLDGPTDSTEILRLMGFSSLYDSDLDLETLRLAVRISSGIFSAIIASVLSFFMGLGEGLYYGSKENAIKYAGIGTGISLVIGFISGYVAQYMYATLKSDVTSDIAAAFVRGIGWSILGLGVGLCVGLIKPEKKRMLYCALGGTGGGFIGGFIFDFIILIFRTSDDDTGIVPRAVGIIVMALLIGLGIGMLEQMAKTAWLKVVRGEFEGKEYLVFSGKTSIGNNGKNTIVLFKDKLVSPHHCDITLEGTNYVITDCGSSMGTVVNGNRITTKHVLRKGDTIAIGNSVLVFKTK